MASGDVPLRSAGAPAGIRRVLVAALGDEGVCGPASGVGSAARALRDAGDEVIGAGFGYSAEMIVAAAIDEDVDGVVLDGSACDSGESAGIAAAVTEALRQAGVAITVELVTH